MISFVIIGHGTNLYNTKTGMEMKKMNKASKFHQEMVRELQVFSTALIVSLNVQRILV